MSLAARIGSAMMAALIVRDSPTPEQLLIYVPVDPQYWNYPNGAETYELNVRRLLRCIRQAADTYDLHSAGESIYRHIRDVVSQVRKITDL